LDHLVKTSAAPFSTVWTARALSGPATGAPLPTPRDVGREWQELGQGWRDQPEPHFNPGWARIRWDRTGLLFEAVFMQRQPANRARTLNERTWELGDIAEFFLQDTSTGRYLELHVTPENQRLQLRWPPDGLARFRAGTAPLEQFLIKDPHWVHSDTAVAADHWTARAYVPLNCLGLPPGMPLPVFRAAVCRYDRSQGPEILSSTARLSAPNYHLYAEWPELRLAAGPA
jgi:hypothetical protein